MTDIPVTPDVLRWAREAAGLSVDDVVEKLNRQRITAETVDAWESGDGSPTYPQLERLAYEIYKRPLAIFFFPERPQESTPRQSFRTLPDYEIEAMPSRVRYLLRKARAFQLNLEELHEGVSPSDRHIVSELDFEPDVPAQTMARTVREYLGVSLENQFAFEGTEDALKTWRSTLESVGISVFKDAFKEDSLSGFCLYNETFPLIYVNNSKSFPRQIFTLFHELAHLLFETGGIDATNLDYLDHLEGDARRIEILCNRFAGEFLVPSDDFDARVVGVQIDEQVLLELAHTYHVSREVILRKFRDREAVSQAYYNERVAAWRGATTSRDPGGHYYNNQGAYLSEPYLAKAFNRYHQNQIGVEQLADYLNVKIKSVPGMEAVLLRRSAAQ